MYRILPIFFCLICCKSKDHPESKPEVITTYKLNGKFKSIEYKKNQSDSRVVSYYNGKISSIANYHNGKFTDSLIFFYSNGNKNFEEYYDSLGYSTGTFHLWYDNGQLKQIGKKEKGSMTGEWKSFFPDGKLESIENYLNGKRNGTWLYFQKNGDTIKEETYQLDSLFCVKSKKNADTTMRYKMYVFLADTVLHDKLLDANNMGKFDVYKYKNDTIIQLAYIHYISEKKMIYLLTTYNRSNKKYCQVYDTATCPVETFTDNAASYEDETLNGESYGAYEYFTEHNGMETTIGVEPSRGKRLSVYSTLNEHCDPGIPINSVGTLRMIKKSNIPQKAHGIPKE